MSEPLDYPTVRYYADGRFVLVETPWDYVALEPGHADNPSGPFPAVPEEASVPPEGLVRHQQARQLRQEGYTQQAIAEKLGVSRGAVRRWLGEA